MVTKKNSSVKLRLDRIWFDDIFPPLCVIDLYKKTGIPAGFEFSMQMKHAWLARHGDSDLKLYLHILLTLRYTIYRKGAVDDG